RPDVEDAHLERCRGVGVAKEGRDLVLLPCVERSADGATAGRFDVGHERRELLPVAAPHEDREALGGELARDRGADVVAGAGDGGGAHTASTRAGVLLCQGVPATQSRSSPRVSSFGATPVAAGAPLASGKSRPRPFGSDTWPGCIRSDTSIPTSALPRRVEMRTRPPFATPRRRASAGFMRNAPAASFFRQPGLRMMVFAVNERRSPAESRNGNAALVPGGGSVARPSSSSKSSGIASWTWPFGVPTRARFSAH